jgi:deoxyribose-phosphate aldolase
VKVNRYIDHTILKADATLEEITKVCDEAKEHEFFSVCVNPYYIPVVKKQLSGTIVKVCAVVGFPLGASASDVKAYETLKAIEAGADEIDMVINVAALKNGDFDLVKSDIAAVKSVTRDKALLKVIIEACLLTDDQKIKACELSKEVGAEFVKTSTGFSTGGATVHDIALMRSVVGPDMGVKASGGVRDYQTAIAMIEAGATRIGASSSVSIAERTQVQTNGY